MTKLFLDTTSKLRLGLLDKADQLICLESFEDKKTSHIVHCKIKEILEKHTETQISELAEIIYIAGPGSYTGTRLGSGIVDLLAWQGLKTYSFYHFDTPFFSGIEAGTWFCKAFKNEMFIFDWNGDESNHYLIDERDLKTELESKKHSLYSYEKLEIGIDYIDTDELLTSHLSDICKRLRTENIKKDIFYFRTAENEFKRSSKP